MNRLCIFVFLLCCCCLTPVFASCKWPLVKSGSREEPAYTAQALLNYRGYSTNGIDSIFGSGSVAATKKFQSSKGLTADGMIGKDTWEQLIVDVRPGDQGYAVQGVQHSLRYQYGYASVLVDGMYGNGTLLAVNDFQKKNNEPLTNGRIGQLTWLGLTSGCNATSSPPSSGKTVAQMIDAVGCSTVVVAGLSAQLVDETNCLQPGLFSNMNNLRGPISFSSAAKAVPFLQTGAANALQKAIDQQGSTLGVNSALRSIVQQLMLRTWYERNQCGITAAAIPGHSNHNSGSAIDIQDADQWKTSMEANHWKKLGDWDRMHYDYTLGKDVRTLSVKAFQSLWNLNNPNDQIDVDGLYGPGTKSKMLASPADGFPKSSSC